jgi:hypothetical protein
VALIIFALLVVGGLAVYRVGWAEGYKMAQLVVGGEEGVIASYAPYRFGFPGVFLTLGVILLLFVVVGKFLRFWAWKASGGPWMADWSKPERWARHWHHHRPPMPPWHWGPEEDAQERRSRADSADAKAEV